MDLIAVLQDRRKEELAKDLLYEVLLLDDLLSEGDVEVVDDLATQLDQTNVEGLYLLVLVTLLVLAILVILVSYLLERVQLLYYCVVLFYLVYCLR